MIALFRLVISHMLGPECAYPALAAESVRLSIEDQR